MKNLGISRDLWLHMLKEGGPFKPLELKDIGGPAYGQVITSLREAGSIKRFESGTYGVTPDCKVPNGVTLRELTECGVKVAT